MCGVFAYIGYRTNAAQIIFEGLKTLEYRGYDSWGIAIKSSGKISVEKHIGKIGDTKINLPKSQIGIGHTRWATHGNVTLENAHPHLDCTKKIALLHNGIIENYKGIKNKLASHNFTSQTDTEALVHLVEDLTEKYGFIKSCEIAFKKIEGLNAIVVLNNETGEIVALKNGSPLVLGKGKNEYFIASDAVGILPYTKKVIFLKDGEMAVFSKELVLRNIKTGNKIRPQIEVLDWDIQNAEKGKFEHFMLKEIFEQPSILENLSLTSESGIARLALSVKKAHGTFFVGAGTAYNACLAGVYLFSKIAKKHANTTQASEFNYLEDFINGRSLIIALSQSGETIDIIEPMIRAKKKKAKLVGIINTLGSTLYRMSDETFLLNAGPEKAVASTKAYTAKLITLILLVYHISGKFEEGKKIVSNAIKEINRILSDEVTSKIKNLAQKLKDKNHIYVIGRGYSYSSSLEAALKIKEVSYIHTEGLAGGELKHGSIALIDKGTICIVFAPKDETYNAIISNATEIKARGGYVIGISSINSDVFDEWIEVKDSGVGTIVSQIVPMQLLAYYISVYKNLDPDKPRNLAKSVTVK